MWHHNKPVMHKDHPFCCLSFLRCLSVFSLFGPSVTQPVVTFKELMIWSHPSLSSSCLSLSVSYYYVESAYVFFLDLNDLCQPFIWVALFCWWSAFISVFCFNLGENGLQLMKNKNPVPQNIRILHTSFNSSYRNVAFQEGMLIYTLNTHLGLLMHKYLLSGMEAISLWHCWSTGQSGLLW